MGVDAQPAAEPAAGPAAAAAAVAAGTDAAPLDEVEPQLKYERLGADVKTILSASSATCLCLSEKVLALGTSKGKIHVLDYSGNEVNCFSPHTAPVQQLSFDEKAEYIASTSHDTHVAVSNLFTGEVSKYAFKRPILVAALDPGYCIRKNKEFVTGDVRGKVKISSQGWLGRSDHLVADEGRPVAALQWSGGVLVWATHLLVKVYDTNAHQLIGSLSRPKHGAHAASRHCSLYLHEGNTLYIAWADAVRVVRIAVRQDSSSSLGGAAAGGTFSAGGAVAAAASAAAAAVSGGGAGMRYQLQTISSFSTNYVCLGVVPHGGDLAVLAYMTDTILQQEQQQQQQEEAQQEGQQPASAEAAGAPSPAAAVAGGDDAGTAEAEAAAGVSSPGQRQQQDQQQQGSVDAAAAAEAAAEQPAGAAGSPDGGADSSSRVAPEASEPSASAPIHIPQRARGSKRAATALVQSPGGSSLLQAAATPGGAGAASGTKPSLAAVALGSELASPTPDSTLSSPTAAASTPGSTVVLGGEPVASPSRGGSRRNSDASPGVTSRRGESAGGAVSAPPTPSTPGLPRLAPGSRTTSIKSVAAEATEAGKDYVPQGTPLRPELRIVTLDHQEVASDALTVRGYAAWLPSSYTLVPSYSNIEALMMVQYAAGSSSSALEGGGVDALAGKGEFMYFIVSPQDIVIGRFRDAEDRITWFLAHRQYRTALNLAERERGLPQAVYDATVQAFLEHLTSTGQWQAAASHLGRLLRGSPDKWDRWVAAFAAAGQVAQLAALVPIDHPRLQQVSYELVLNGLLREPAQHGRVLLLVQSWPKEVYSATALIDNIAQEMRLPGGETPELWQALALLYQGQGRPDLSLAIYLQLQLPLVFNFIQDNSALLTQLDHKAALLLAIDEQRALQLLVSQHEVLPPAVVVPGLLDALEAAEGPAAQEAWRRRLHQYLHQVFLLDPSATAEFAELQVHLYAEYAPQQLLEFLSASQYYPLEAALEVVGQRGMVREQVYLLSRMGNAREALALIIQVQRDIPAAIDFVEAQRDDELWEELITWALQEPATTGQLLEHIGGHLNPLCVIEKLPHGMVIHNLRDRLRAIIADFRTQTSLREGCNAILRSDCYVLMRRLHHDITRALPIVYIAPAAARGAPQQVADAAAAGGGEGQWERYACGSLTGAVRVPLEAVPQAVQAAAAVPPLTGRASGSLEGAAAAAGGGGGDGGGASPWAPATRHHQSNARLVYLTAAGAAAAAAGGGGTDGGDGEDAASAAVDRSAVQRFAASSGKSVTAAGNVNATGAAGRPAGRVGGASPAAAGKGAGQRAQARLGGPAEGLHLPSLIIT